jgi:hypothetical protein
VSIEFWLTFVTVSLGIATTLNSFAIGNLIKTIKSSTIYSKCECECQKEKGDLGGRQAME